MTVPGTQPILDEAAALRLDADATAHLHRLAAPDRPRRARPRAPERVPAGIAQRIGTWPAFVQGRLFDVLAANPLAQVLSPLYVPGANMIRSLFLDPDTVAAHDAGR